MSDNKTRKRCSKGSRKDPKTGLCIKYASIKTFEKLSEQTISPTKNTLSLESLGKSGSILKIYEGGELKTQAFVSDEELEKAKKKGQKDIQNILKMMHNVQKNPSKIEKDKVFKKLRKIIKGGDIASATIESNTDILIQNDVMDKIETKKVIKLEDKIENLQTNKKTVSSKVS
jgi:cAMP phosphodiesterase